jgi:hypothetical protein
LRLSLLWRKSAILKNPRVLRLLNLLETELEADLLETELEASLPNSLRKQRALNSSNLLDPRLEAENWRVLNGLPLEEVAHH